MMNGQDPGNLNRVVEDGFADDTRQPYAGEGPGMTPPASPISAISEPSSVAIIQRGAADGLHDGDFSAASPPWWSRSGSIP